MIKEYKHIKFLMLELNRETNPPTLKYLCANKSQEDLGLVQWYEPWKQYCYFDKVEGIYSQSCLLDIADFLSQLNNLKNNPK